MVQAYLTIPPAEERPESTKQVAQEFRDLIPDIPDAKEISINYTIDQGNGPALNFAIEGDDLDALRLAALDLQDLLEQMPGAYDASNSLAVAHT